MLCRTLNVAIMNTAERNCGHFLVESHQMHHAGENLGILLRIWPLYVYSDFFRYFSKMVSFFSSPFTCLSLLEVILFLQCSYRIY